MVADFVIKMILSKGKDSKDRHIFQKQDLRGIVKQNIRQSVKKISQQPCVSIVSATLPNHLRQIGKVKKFDK